MDLASSGHYFVAELEVKTMDRPSQCMQMDAGSRDFLSALPKDVSRI
jgi:hypothetical protein